MEEPSVERVPEPDAASKQHRAVATLLGGLAAVALFFALRSEPAVIARPARHPGSQVTTPALLVVHVAGAVRAPGIYELHAGTRVADAIEAAGGPRPRADLSLLNLAEPIRDGMQIVVGGPAVGSAPAVTSSPAEPAAVDLNTADHVALETIPGIGPVKAAAIVAHRTEQGPFASVEELLEVTGIGPATLEALRPYVTI